MKIEYREAGSDDIARQYRYYLNVASIAVAVRFRSAVQRTVRLLSRHPLAGQQLHSGSPRIQTLRSWPVIGFRVIRIYYTVEQDKIRILRVLHGKRDVAGILEQDRDV